MSSQQKDGTSLPFFSDPKLCANNCGFWGNPTTMNLCSKCYKEVSLREQTTAAVKISLEANEAAIADSSSTPAVAAAAEDPAKAKAALIVNPVVNASIAAVEEPAKPKAANRCGTCNKKVGLTGFKCKCGGMFCGDHRYPERHECCFDYKAAGRDAIAKSNPVVKADKVDRF